MKKMAFNILLACIAIIWTASSQANEASVAEEIKAIQQMIEENGYTWEAGYNEIMDLPMEERRLRLGLRVPEEIQRMFENLDPRDFPILARTESVFDWRLLGGVTPVTDQGNCGSCWAFAAAAGFESAFLISSGDTVDISEQAIVSCDYNSDGCNGGWTGSAFTHLATHGAKAESCMPYEQDDTVPCTEDECDVIAYLDGYQPLPNNVNVIKSMLTLGPVTTSYTVYDDFYSYQRGCYEHDANTEPTNHAALIVGWDDNECNGEGAWIVKNSWGPDWGRLGGYFYIKYGSAAFGSSSLFPIYNLTGVGEVSYSPESFEVEVAPGNETTDILHLTNIGDGALRYYVDAYTVTDLDEFGYYWRDSDDGDGPTYNWVDISDVGQVVDFWGYNNDGNSGQLNMGFNFEFYGNTYNRFNICVNGWASFNSAYILEWENSPIPSWNLPNNMMPVFFDNLNMEYGGQALYYTNNTDSAVITWDGIPDNRQEGVFTFQAIMVAPNTIVYQYNSMGPGRLNECTIGIEDRLGNVGTQVACNNDYVHDNLAIRFALGDAPPPLTWLTSNPQSGIILPFGNQDVELTFDPADLPPGDQHAMLTLMSTSIDEPYIEIPITLSMMPTDVSDYEVEIPTEFALRTIYPNPFNPSATISYSIPQAGYINLDVYNLLGQRVASLYNGQQTAGIHTINWQPENLSSGIYLVKLSNSDIVKTTRVTLMK